MEKGIVLLKFCIFSFGKEIVHINFFGTKRCLASEYVKRNVHVKNAIFILSAFMREER